MKDYSKDGNVKLIRFQEEVIDGAVWLGSNKHSSCNTEVAMLDVICSIQMAKTSSKYQCWICQSFSYVYLFFYFYGVGKNIKIFSCLE